MMAAYWELKYGLTSAEVSRRVPRPRGSKRSILFPLLSSSSVAMFPHKVGRECTNRRHLFVFFKSSLFSPLISMYLFTMSFHRFVNLPSFPFPWTDDH